MFNVHAANAPSQSLSAERLVLTPAAVSQTHTDAASGNRYLRVHAVPGTLKPSYARLQAIRDWVHGHFAFTPHSSSSNTSALDTLIDQVGVCRDCAHLMFAPCRAMNSPARYATGSDSGPPLAPGR